jgi:hypothetical protein
LIGRSTVDAAIRVTEMTPVITMNALLVWFVWGFFMGLAGRWPPGWSIGCWRRSEIREIERADPVLVTPNRP